MTVSADPQARELTGSEAARLLAEHGRNEVAADRRVPLWTRVAAQLRDPLITVLLAAVALTVAIGDHPDAAALRQADIGVAMGAEPASPGAMTRLPRPPDQHILGSGVWQRVLLLAAVVAAAALGAALWALEDDRPWQTVLFLALLAGQLGTVLGLRERLLTRANPFLPLAVLASAALAAAALYLPLLRGLLDTVPLGRSDLAAPVLAGAVGFTTARLLKHGI
ncbi:cation transporting ATPase C-terminal domain-containing protein [Kitasatospora sp. NPDC058063]|uniref:cation transporting ATPase C-terminal domain-containing protein n=1 Tax=unclassified Kitasatospora TaxID=2633591 RepID=UPI0036DBAD44